jgi:Kef-type K+ transport system membrane component KefB
MCGLIILVASAGKFGGSSLAASLASRSIHRPPRARFLPWPRGVVASLKCRLEWRDSAALGILMNTRGLMELIVLNIGLDLGVISPTLFAMLVLMALVTTVATAPILFVIASEQDPGAGIAIKPDVIRSTRSVDRSIATVARIAAATGDRTE